jgi:hypothetical protein
MFFALCFAFGLGYLQVSRDLRKNHAVIMMGILGQISVFAVTTFLIVRGDPCLPSLYLVPALVDLGFAVAFTLFLWRYPASAG